MIKLWDTLRNKTQQMLLEQENEELKWEQKYKKERRLRQEAEGELTIVKGISVHMSPEMRDANKKITELQSNLDRIKKENNDLYNRIAQLTDPVQKARESGL